MPPPLVDPQEARVALKGEVMKVHSIHPPWDQASDGADVGNLVVNLFQMLSTKLLELFLISRRVPFLEVEKEFND
jgi:hypothetical protein